MSETLISISQIVGLTMSCLQITRNTAESVNTLISRGVGSTCLYCLIRSRRQSYRVQIIIDWPPDK
jgi:hypothetical protein